MRKALMPLIETEFRYKSCRSVQAGKVQMSTGSIDRNEFRSKKTENNTCPPPRYSGVGRGLHHRLGGIRHGVIVWEANNSPHLGKAGKAAWLLVQTLIPRIFRELGPGTTSGSGVGRVDHNMLWLPWEPCEG